jgi:hypothetical protein
MSMGRRGWLYRRKARTVKWRAARVFSFVIDAFFLVPQPTTSICIQLGAHQRRSPDADTKHRNERPTAAGRCNRASTRPAAESANARLRCVEYILAPHLPVSPSAQPPALNPGPCLHVTAVSFWQSAGCPVIGGGAPPPVGNGPAAASYGGGCPVVGANQMPPSANTPLPGQSKPLSTWREQSSIPTGTSGAAPPQHAQPSSSSSDEVCAACITVFTLPCS